MNPTEIDIAYQAYRETEAAAKVANKARDDIFAQAITVKPGRPSVKVELIKREVA